MTKSKRKDKLIILIDLKDIKPEQIDEQIEVRKKLIGEMVGNLYPAILQGEIDKLKKMRDDFITENEMNL